MRLAAGTHLGPYEIQAGVGAGGMGEVYKARDTRLGRTVAIKVVSGDGAANPDRRRRFEQEARAASALNHPHICVLHDIGSQDGIDYLVMEYLEGQTLAERLARGPLAPRQAIEYAIQVADALAKAHREGIVHRDLKPSNVMLTKSGAKLLDFGLARLTDTSPREFGATDSATMSAPGTIVGTLPYMAPEQVQGLPTDSRTDIFAFGCVLYEMVAGRRAFDGATPATVAARILEHEPTPISAVQPTTAPALDRLVRKCLAKDLDGRWQSAADLGTELTWLQDSGQEITARVPSRRRLQMAAAAVLLIALLVAGAFAFGRLLTPSARPDGLQLSIAVADKGLTLTDGGIAISPDGETVVFTARENGVTRLYARQLTGWTVRALQGTENGAAPFFSPDGESIGFVDAVGGLRTVPLRGGPVQPRYEPEGESGNWTTGACWGTTGIVFGRWPQAGLLFQRTHDRGQPIVLTSPPPGTWHMWPEWLPGEEWLLFTVWERGRMSIAAFSIASRRTKTVVPAGSRPRYLPTGHLLYETNGQLMVVGFDVQAVATIGAPVTLVDNVPKARWAGTWQRPNSGHSYDVSRSGTLAYTPASTALPRLVWKDREGRTIALPVERRRFLMPTLSPDGVHFADTIVDGPARNVWIGSVTGGAMTPLTQSNDDCYSLFTPDGKWLLYTSSQDGPYNVYRVPVDRSRPPELVTGRTPNAQRATSWSPGGRILLLNDNRPNTGLDIVQWENGHFSDVLSTRFRERLASFSPDGRWIAYESNESRVDELYVRGYPTGGSTMVSVGGSYGSPVWSPKGDEVFYQGRDGVMAVKVVRGVPLGPPVKLFGHSSEFRNWDVSPDGQRFLVVEDADAADCPPHINVVPNWLQKVKTEVPMR